MCHSDKRANFITSIPTGILQSHESHLANRRLSCQQQLFHCIINLCSHFLPYTKHTASACVIGFHLCLSLHICCNMWVCGSKVLQVSHHCMYLCQNFIFSPNSLTLVVDVLPLSLSYHQKTGLERYSASCTSIHLPIFS